MDENKKEITGKNMEYKAGDKILIVKMKDVPYYNGRAGIINRAYVNPFDEVELKGTGGRMNSLPAFR